MDAHDTSSIGDLLGSVVKVHAIGNPPDYDQPWQSRGPASSVGSGTILATALGPRILTNAHVVEHQVFIEVRRYGTARNFVATVEGVDHDSDLALLAVEEEEFFAGATPIPLGPLPDLSERVSACGFPIGGEYLSVTEGIVSRIELATYAQSQRELLAVQIDAAINAGNSGGPVLKDRKLVGVAFQGLDEGQSIGYMIAAPVVEHFLADLATGKPMGFPDLGVVTQKLESPAQRASLSLPKDPVGVLVTRVVYGGTAWQALRRGDVILAVEGIEVSADGTVPIRPGLLVHFSHLISQRFVDETVVLRIWREGACLEVPLKLRPPQLLVREAPRDLPPTYFINGGLVFVPLTRDYLRSWGEDWWSRAPHNLLAIYEDWVRTRNQLEIVVLQRVLPDRVNQGYHDIESMVVKRVNGQRLRHLRDLVRLVEGARGGYLVFESPTHQQVVLDRKLVRERSPRILERFGIPADRSNDLRS